MKPIKEYYTQVLVFFALLLTLVTSAQDSVRPAPLLKVCLLELKMEVNSVSNRYIKLGLEKAREDKAGLVIIELDTYGGAVIDADEIRSRLLKVEIPVYVFINQTAGSAGALISIACDSIYMAKGAHIGASTAVNQNGEVLPEKIQAFMRSMMRTTAESQGRDPSIAEGFVGKNLGTDSAYVLSLTTQEAIDTGYCEGSYNSVAEILEATGVTNYELTKFEFDNTEEIIAFFLHPAVKSILVILIIGGLYFELQSPGVGFPLIVAATALILYFVPDYLHGLLASWELLLFFVGVILLVVELFVLPGFGIVGALGIASCFMSLLLSMLKNDFFNFDFVTPEALQWAFMVLGISMIGSVLLVFVGGAAFLKSKAFKKISLQASINQNFKGGISSESSMMGKAGIALTDLKPSGMIRVEGEHCDAAALHGFIPKGASVKVVEDEGVSLKVIIEE